MSSILLHVCFLLEPRYVGKDYSAAQELMEDEMKEYYSKNLNVIPVQAVHVGQLLAVNAEEDTWLRAQVISMEDSKIKASSATLSSPCAGAHVPSQLRLQLLCPVSANCVCGSLLES